MLRRAPQRNFLRLDLWLRNVDSRRHNGWRYARGASLEIIVLNPIHTAKLLLFPFFWWVVPVIVDTNRVGADSLAAAIAGVGLALIARVERGSTL
jgi:hypothetical protein